MRNRLGLVARLGLIAVLVLGWLLPAGVSAADWLRSGVNTDRPEWGIAGGLHWAIFPGSGTGNASVGGPRGLIRLAAPCLKGGKYKLVNWLAVEPKVVGGPRGFSELEHSHTDGKAGKCMVVEGAAAGVVTTPAAGVEELSVVVGVERFNNGAAVSLTVSQRSDRPEEIAISVHAGPGGRHIEECVITATCGNKTRSRLLFLGDGRASSLLLWPTYRAAQFAPDQFFSGARMLRDADRSRLVAITTDEKEPRTVHPKDTRWYYGGQPITQYWRVPEERQPDRVRVRVNGRAMYWATRENVPGGIAFENFEIRQPWVDGQTIGFGISLRNPRELGFPE